MSLICVENVGGGRRALRSTANEWHRSYQSRIDTIKIYSLTFQKEIVDHKLQAKKNQGKNLHAHSRLS